MSKTDKAFSMDQKNVPTWDDYYQIKTKLSFMRAFKKRYTDEVLALIDRTVKASIQTALEIGSGEGTFLASVCKRFGATPYGVDISDVGIEECRKTLQAAGLDGSHLVVRDVFSAELKREWKDRFDLVTSFGFVEHFDDIAQPIEAHANYARPGGACFFTIPHFGNWYNRTFCWLAKGPRVYDEMTFNEKISERWITEACHASGLDVVEIGVMRSWPVFRPSSPLWALLSAPMQALALGSDTAGIPIPRILGATYYVIARKR